MDHSQKKPAPEKNIAPDNAAPRFGLARIRRGIARRIGLGQSHLRALIKLPGRLARQPHSRRIQRESFAQNSYGTCKKLVVFLIPGISYVTGGGLQIFSLHRLTREYFRGTATDSLICWLPGEGWDIHRFEGFSNNVTVFSLEMVLQNCAAGCELLLHLPEYAAGQFCDRLGWQRLAALRRNHGLRINILNQNIERMPDRSFFERLQRIFPDLTSTVANSAWMSADERRRQRIPMHLLPTWYFPDDAPWQPYETKSNLMIVSPDADPHRELVLGAIRRALPDLRIEVIWGLKYEQYMALERTAKWSLTFGEGLDGYFYGPVFRGGVAFAVRNGTFDVEGFENRQTIYPSYQLMADCIVNDIEALDHKDAYEKYNLALRRPLARDYGRELTVNALAAFYRGELTFADASA